VHNFALGKRLQEERQRLGISQTSLGVVGGVSKRTQINYEAGEKAPDTNYLLAISNAGVDLLYILMAEKINGAACTPLSREETDLLGHYRRCSIEGKHALRIAAGALASEVARPPSAHNGATL
jgi:transcriptional regulator with XRE-family HTH domain